MCQSEGCTPGHSRSYSRYSITTSTVMSSDCGVPSVNAATALLQGGVNPPGATGGGLGDHGFAQPPLAEEFGCGSAPR